MRARNLKSELQHNLSVLNGSIAEMEAERVSLALPALSGDAQAMLRLVDLRSDIEDKRAGLRDLEQAISDLEPAVQVENATERLRRREALHGQYGGACAEVMDKMDAIVAAVLQLGEALRAAAAPVDRARHLAVELAVPIAGSDIGHVAQQRMIIAQNLAIRSVRDLVETALEDVQVLVRHTAPFPLRSNINLAEQMRRSLAAIDTRVREALADDRRASVAAGVVLEDVAA
ncbi:MAG: hypothetical protein ACRYF2_04055 [Janthinobacterium lividum]